MENIVFHKDNGMEDGEISAEGGQESHPKVQEDVSKTN